jgi:hypothetical protein
MRDSIEHFPVGTVIHGVEGDFKLDHFGCSGLSHNDDGDEGGGLYRSSFGASRSPA